MSKPLRELIGAREPAFSLRLRLLEQSVHGRSLDNELLSEISVSANQKLRELGLDPLDSTHAEIEAALKEKMAEAEQLLKRSYRNSSSGMVEAFNNRLELTPIPVIRHASLRRILAVIPPKRVMALLGYRSSTSLLKRADLDQLLIGSLLVESITWHRSFLKAISRLDGSHVTYERPRVVVIDKRLQKNARHGNSLLAVPAGVVGIYISDDLNMCQVASELVEATYQLWLTGSYLKLKRFNDRFTSELGRLSYVPKSRVTQIANISLSWQTVYLALNRAQLDLGPDSLLEAKDVWPAYPSQLLHKLHRRLDFWVGNDFLGKTTGHRPISLNFSDVAKHHGSHVTYSLTAHAYMSRMLMSELLSRYLAHDLHSHKLEKIIDVGQA